MWVQHLFLFTLIQVFLFNYILLSSLLIYQTMVICLVVFIFISHGREIIAPAVLTDSPLPFLPQSPPNYFMSNTQISSTVNSQSLETFPLIPANSPTMISNDDVGSQFLQYSTQIELDKIVVDEI